MKPKSKIFREVHDGRLLAIRNWRHRNQSEDAVIAVPLTTDEFDHYHKRKDDGASDEEIFNDLFHEPNGERVAIPITDLNKAQIVKLLNSALQTELATLSRMSRDDLLELLRRIGREEAQRKAWLV